jgi:hypothetical protein
MSYDYRTQRNSLFTDEGLALVMRVRDNARGHAKAAGAFTAWAAWAGCSGNAWDMLAALDYLCEKGEIARVTKGRAGQDEIYEWIGAKQ